MTFECADCDLELPFEMRPVAVNKKTGDVRQIDPEAFFEERGAPECPKCGGTIEYHDTDK